MQKKPSVKHLNSGTHFPLPSLNCLLADYSTVKQIKILFLLKSAGENKKEQADRLHHCTAAYNSPNVPTREVLPFSNKCVPYLTLCKGTPGRFLEYNVKTVAERLPKECLEED